MAAIANHVQSAIGTAVNPISGPVSDAILALRPTIYYKASDGYFTSGAVRIGYIPVVGAVTNWLKSSNAGLACGSLGWSATCVFCIDTDTGANQTIASKAASANYEWQLTWIRSSATTGSLRLTCYTANGASSITATSAVSVNVGTAYQVSWAYDGDDCHISVNNESLVTSAGTLTMVSGTADFRIGSYQITDQHFNGRIDSFGISIGDQYCLAQRTQFYNSGAFNQYADITGIKTLTAWWDFGNATTNSTGYDPTHVSYDRQNLTEWDWLLDVTGNGYTLSQAGASHKPWIVRGLTAPALTTATTQKVLGVFDASGNGNDAVTPWYGSRISYDPDGWSSGVAAFMFPGAVSTGANDYNGGFLTNWTAASQMTGTNVSWSIVCVCKTPDPWNPSAQSMSGDEWLGMTLAGTGPVGHVPWTTYGSASGYAGDGGTAIRWLTSTKYEPVYAHQVHRWSSQRMADDQKKNKVYTAWRGCLDTNDHVIVYTYDGSTQTPLIYIDGIVQSFDSAQTSDNGGGAGSLGAMTCRAIQFGEGMLYPDQQVFPPTYKYGSGGWAWYGPMKSMAFWAGTVLTAQNAADLTAALKTNYAATASTATFNFPPITTSLKQWWEPRSGYGLYTSRTINIVGSATKVTADGNAVGQWRSRYGLGPSAGLLPLHLIPDTDGHRPTYETATQNSLPCIHTVAASGQYLSAVTQALSQPLTLYMCVKMTRVGASYNYLFASGSGIEYGSASNVQQYFYGGTVSKTWVETKPAQETFRVCCMVFNGASSVAEIDGVVVGSGTNIGTAGLTTMFFATYNGALYMATLDLGDILLYGAAHDSTQRATMRTWLKALWGTA